MIDQANVPDGGDRLYIYTPGSWSEPRETYYLWELAQGVGDGAGTRPHLLTFNSTHSHAILANVASGHVYIIRAADRKIVASIDVGEQAHGALASPDDKQILVSNQNGKKLARIHADFATETFRYDAVRGSEPGRAGESEPAGQRADLPDDVRRRRHARRTSRCAAAGCTWWTRWPRRWPILKEYPKDQMAPAGCGGIEHAGVVYVNSGSPADGHIYLFDAKTDALVKTIPTAQCGSDAHGMALLGGRYLWMGHRGNGDNIVVLDTTTQEIVGQIDDVGAAPDLLDVEPGRRAGVRDAPWPRRADGRPERDRRDAGACRSCSWTRAARPASASRSSRLATRAARPRRTRTGSPSADSRSHRQRSGGRGLPRPPCQRPSGRGDRRCG